MEASAGSPRGREMEAGVNEDIGEMAEQNSLHGDGKYRAITEGDTTRMAHERAGPIPNIRTTSAYYEGDPAQYIIVNSFQSTRAGQLSGKMMSQLSIQVQTQLRSQWKIHKQCPGYNFQIIKV